MPASQNYHVSWSKSNDVMNKDCKGAGTWSIHGSDYGGIKIGNAWVYLISRAGVTQNQLLKQSEYHTEHKLSHIIVGNNVYEIGD